MRRFILPAIALILFSLAVFPQANGWNDPFPAHRVMDNLYYVGTKELASEPTPQQCFACHDRLKKDGLVLSTYRD